LTGIAWAILSSTANETQVASAVANLEKLRFAVRYKTIPSDEEMDDYQLAPNSSGFLPKAFVKSHRNLGVNNTTTITHLHDILWMISRLVSRCN